MGWEVTGPLSVLRNVIREWGSVAVAGGLFLVMCVASIPTVLRPCCDLDVTGVEGLGPASPTGPTCVNEGLGQHSHTFSSPLSRPVAAW